MADVNLSREALPQPPGFGTGTSSAWENYKPASSSNGGWDDNHGGNDGRWDQERGSDGDKWAHDKWSHEKWPNDKSNDKWSGYSGGGGGKKWGKSNWSSDANVGSWYAGGCGGLVGEESATVEIHDEEIEFPRTEMLLSSENFASFGLGPEVMEGINSLGYVRPSVIQAHTLPRILGEKGQGGKSLQAQAQNGSGKTACFSIAVLHALDISVLQPQAIILCPTRELARQNHDFLNLIGFGLRLKTKLVCPGMERVPTGSTIDVHVLIGTPGKMMDMCKKRFAYVRELKVLVLDEADVMLDQENFMGNHVMDVRKHCPENVQILFFSATYPDHVQIFARNLLASKTVIKVSKEALTVATIQQTYKVCADESDKFEQLMNIFGSLSMGQSIVFFNSRRKAFQIAEQLRDEGRVVSLICGSQRQDGQGEDYLSVEERDRVMSEFRGGMTQVLVATDVLCRGIDIPQVTLVVNYEMPLAKGWTSGVAMETYLHRVGRTGRFGLKGVSVSLVTPDEIKHIQEVMDHFQCKIMEIDYDWEEFQEKLTTLRVEYDKANGNSEQ
ncbi:dbp5 [Symbiodinium pilosum]|uniref:RNA helicase n=1 Tax=Symbiodinium pilosum TaxID=2952 RepID=A0A812XS49_SYMPI|nr:dbp5 [Symbiodinium pilosum]